MDFASSRWLAADVELFVLRPDDVTDAYAAWLNNPAINQYLELRFFPHTVTSTREYVASMLVSPDNLFLGIRSVVLGRHVGNIKLGPVNQHHGTAEIGIVIGDRHAWGRGLATQAIQVIADIARQELKLRKVTAGCYESNVGSKRAFEKAGFVIEGVRPGQVLANGKPEALILMGRLLK